MQIKCSLIEPWCTGSSSMKMLALIQYVFSEDEHEVIVQKYGNSKEDKPYFRTFPKIGKRNTFTGFIWMEEKYKTIIKTSRPRSPILLLQHGPYTIL